MTEANTDRWMEGTFFVMQNKNNKLEIDVLQWITEVLV